MIRRLKYFAAIMAVLLLGGLITSNSAMAAYPTSPTMGYYGAWECTTAGDNGDCRLYRGEFTLYSSNGRDKLAFGMSGNFAGYDSAGRQWFSANTTNIGAEIRFQHDGNVVVYDSGHPAGTYLAQQPLWDTATYPAYGVYEHRYRITMGGNGTFSIWREEDFDSTGYNYTWLRLKTFGNGA